MEKKILKLRVKITHIVSKMHKYFTLPL